MDTLSRLLEIDPGVALPAEPQGTEFGCNFFEELSPDEVGEIIIEGVKTQTQPQYIFQGCRSYSIPEVKVNQITTSQRF